MHYFLLKRVTQRSHTGHTRSPGSTVQNVRKTAFIRFINLKFKKDSHRGCAPMSPAGGLPCPTPEIWTHSATTISYAFERIYDDLNDDLSI